MKMALLNTFIPLLKKRDLFWHNNEKERIEGSNLACPQWTQAISTAKWSNAMYIICSHTKESILVHEYKGWRNQNNRIGTILLTNT